MVEKTKLLTPIQVADMIGVTEWCLRNWRHKGNKGPKFIKLGERFVRYRQSDVDAWLTKNERVPK